MTDEEFNEALHNLTFDFSGPEEPPDRRLVQGLYDSGIISQYQAEKYIGLPMEFWYILRNFEVAEEVERLRKLGITF